MQGGRVEKENPSPDYYTRSDMVNYARYRLILICVPERTLSSTGGQCPRAGKVGEVSSLPIIYCRMAYYIDIQRLEL